MIPESKHLSDEQFAECLTGEIPSVATREHLAACAVCRAEMELFTGSVKSFDNATMDWSRMQAAPRLAAKTSRQRTSVAAPLGWALATAFVLVFGAPTVMNRFFPPHTAHVAPTEEYATEIAQDNKLMASVDVALSEEDPSPFREYHIAEPAAQRTKGLIEARSR